MRFKAGFVTIGQSPRTDVFEEMADLLGPEIEVIEKGALDRLSCSKIRGLWPEKRDFPLITRLKNGTTVRVGRKKIIPLLQKQVRELEKEGVKIIAFLCTENFPEIKSRCALLFPSRILFHTVHSILRKGKLAVFIPLEEQREGARKKWEKTGLDVIVKVLNPYQKFNEIEKALVQIKKENVDLVVLDCIGYTMKIKERIRQKIRKPVLLPKSLLARTIRELL